MSHSYTQLKTGYFSGSISIKKTEEAIVKQKDEKQKELKKFVDDTIKLMEEAANNGRFFLKVNGIYEKCFTPFEVAKEFKKIDQELHCNCGPGSIVISWAKTD